MHPKMLSHDPKHHRPERLRNLVGGVLFINAIYIPLLEEPGLVRRFGADYETYRRHVPRWIPRLSPWNPAPSQRGVQGPHA